MSAYSKSPFSPSPTKLVGNQPGYSAGSKNTNTPNTRMIVSRDSVSTNVVTLTVTVVEGNIPAVGSSIFVRGTQRNSGGLNTSAGSTVTAVSIDATTGQGTISYGQTTANLVDGADQGEVIVLVPEVAEALVTAQAYKQFAVDGYGVSWAYTCPSQPSAISIQLEGAINDNDSEYTIIGTAQTTTSGYNEFFATLPELVRFVRIKVASMSGGTNPTLIAKILNSPAN